jgi:hypothetical protein
MRPLTGELLLSAWDQGMANHDVERALIMLSIALPEEGHDHLAELPIAERNALLLRLRAITFGPVLRGFTECSNCGAAIEFTLPVDTLLSRSEVTPSFHLRPVNSHDLLALFSTHDCADAEKLLLTRCLKPNSTQHLSVSDLRKEFELLNASSETLVALECPTCSQQGQADFDAAHFLWAEVKHAASRLLVEIHELASAYGWSESAIAAMSAQRRSAYMEMLDA